QLPRFPEHRRGLGYRRQVRLLPQSMEGVQPSRSNASYLPDARRPRGGDRRDCPPRGGAAAANFPGTGTGGHRQHPYRFQGQLAEPHQPGTGPSVPRDERVLRFLDRQRTGLGRQSGDGNQATQSPVRTVRIRHLLRQPPLRHHSPGTVSEVAEAVRGRGYPGIPM
ncbi:uncharacterized protein METZ01_LOCUS241252, partial [marine metagenome]